MLIVSLVSATDPAIPIPNGIIISSSFAFCTASSNAKNKDKKEILIIIQLLNIITKVFSNELCN